MGAGINTYFPTGEERKLSILAEKKYPKAKSPKNELIRQAVKLYCEQLEKEFGAIEEPKKAKGKSARAQTLERASLFSISQSYLSAKPCSVE